MHVWLSIVGIGEDGFDGLPRAARRVVLAATEIHGGRRHLAMLPARVRAARVPWPQPFSVEAVLARRGHPVCVLASGDPMFHGVGAVLARHVPAAEMAVWPAPSSVALAAARMGWPLHETATVSLLSAPPVSLARHLRPGGRLLVLSAGAQTPAAVAAWLCGHGYGRSRLTVWEHLGGEREHHQVHAAQDWPADAPVAALNVIAIEAVCTDEAPALPCTSGLADAFYRHDGQLTKREVRALTLALLAPKPGELLWDVGAGAGSIGIEWMRADPACRAVAVEADAGRQAYIAHNSEQLGVPDLRIVAGRAPEALRGLPAPDAIFVGGGVTAPGVLEACWGALPAGGRLLANAVTLQAERRLLDWRAGHGGRLIRIELARAEPLGRFETWRPSLPVTVYEAVRG